MELDKKVDAAHVSPADDHTAEAVLDLNKGQGTEVNIDCSGSEASRYLCSEVASDAGGYGNLHLVDTPDFASLPEERDA